MESIISLLPDNLANQIAAGEVVQRPASVVKELLENAIDAKANRVELHIKDAGKTLIQVSDNGTGMSALDARMCFERHATSKIKQPSDLFSIRTLGFRGEALASIAAVAQVKLRTCLEGTEVGTELEIEGNEIKKQNACITPVGTVFQVKNLFFNVPARRNFLKSNPVETRHILNEFLRVAIPHPEITMVFRHNDSEVFHLTAGSLEKRLIALMGNDLKGKLMGVEELTGYVAIKGFIGSPEISRKSREEQFLFVNGRYIKSHFLHHAIMTAYSDTLPKEHYPFYCIFLEIDPIHVDINIHPTKTEVKFDDENTLYALLHGAVKRHLGAYHVAPELDFNNDNNVERLFASNGKTYPKEPTVIKDFFQTPISKELPQKQYVSPQNWDNLYRPVSGTPTSIPQPPQEEETEKQTLFPTEEKKDELAFVLPYLQKYILTSYQQQLFIIDKTAAYQRIMFEHYLEIKEGVSLKKQTLLFPQTFELSQIDKTILLDEEELLSQIGMELKDFSGNSVIVYSIPSDISPNQIKEMLLEIAAEMKEAGNSRIREKMVERLAKQMAIKTATLANRITETEGLKSLVFNLFACQNPAFSPTGKPTFKVIKAEELTAFFG
ncbi:MAG: DNA mismatch repair endonuclease MutL [Bacteroidia bacterium]